MKMRSYFWWHCMILQSIRQGRMTVWSVTTQKFTHKFSSSFTKHRITVSGNIARYSTNRLVNPKNFQVSSPAINPLYILEQSLSLHLKRKIVHKFCQKLKIKINWLFPFSSRGQKLKGKFFSPSAWVEVRGRKKYCAYESQIFKSGTFE